ncbi:MAG: PilN domain-containing protein [Cystobacterineae bacterium]|nr:PilN domain-containing protein [Cystobacterineae bacterium]
MYIYINLLPVRQVKRREYGIQTLVLLGLVLVAAIVLNFIWHRNILSTQEREARRIASMQSKIQELEKTVVEIGIVEKRRDEIIERLKVLEELKGNRKGAALVLNTLALAVPSGVVLDEVDENVRPSFLKGRASSHDDVAEFMRQLQAIVSTPQGIARIVDKPRNGFQVRVEFLSIPGKTENVLANSVKYFFQNIELKRAEQKADNLPGTPSGMRVNFEIQLSVNYLG